MQCIARLLGPDGQVLMLYEIRAKYLPLLMALWAVLNYKLTSESFYRIKIFIFKPKKIYLFYFVSGGVWRFVLASQWYASLMRHMISLFPVQSTAIFGHKCDKFAWRMWLPLWGNILILRNHQWRIESCALRAQGTVAASGRK